MERVVGWVDAEGGQRWQAGPEAFGGRNGLTLRPTGMVVFATMERARPEGMLPPIAPAPAWALREPLPPGTRGGRSPRAAAAPLAQAWRHRVLRGAAWLLGR
jgi:hypothetical protein